MWLVCIGSKNVAGVLERGIVWMSGRKASGGLFIGPPFFFPFSPSHSLGPFLRVWRVGDVYDTGTVSQTGTHSKKVCYDIGIIPWDIMRLECIIEGVGNDSEVCCGSVGGCAPVMCSSGYGNFAKEGGTK